MWEARHESYLDPFVTTKIQYKVRLTQQARGILVPNTNCVPLTHYLVHRRSGRQEGQNFLPFGCMKHGALSCDDTKGKFQYVWCASLPQVSPKAANLKTRSHLRSMFQSLNALPEVGQLSASVTIVAKILQETPVMDPPVPAVAGEKRSGSHVVPYRRFQKYPWIMINLVWCVPRTHMVFGLRLLTPRHRILVLNVKNTLLDPELQAPQIINQCRRMLVYR